MHSPATSRITADLILHGMTRDLGLERFAEGRMLEETASCDGARNLSPLLASNELGSRWRARKCSAPGPHNSQEGETRCSEFGKHR
jgi:hypothetical protein